MTLKEAMGAAGISKAQMAERTGIPERSVKRYMEGGRPAQRYRLQMMCAVLGKRVSDIDWPFNLQLDLEDAL